MLAGMRADLLRGHLDGLLLAVLADAPAHGYELGQRLAQRSGGGAGVAGGGAYPPLPPPPRGREGSLYPPLHRLERGGLVASVWRTDDGRRPRVYRLTRSGRRAVSASREEWRALFGGAAGGRRGGPW